MKRTDVVSLAEAAAQFFRTLLADGVPEDAAVDLTATFVSATVMGWPDEVKPVEPWERGQ